MQGLTTFHKECAALMKDAKLFPIEVDLTRNSFQYKSTMPGESFILDNSIYPHYHVLYCMKKLCNTTRTKTATTRGSRRPEKRSRRAGWKSS